MWKAMIDLKRDGIKNNNNNNNKLSSLNLITITMLENESDTMNVLIPNSIFGVTRC